MTYEQTVLTNMLIQTTVTHALLQTNGIYIRISREAWEEEFAEISNVLFNIIFLILLQGSEAV